MSDPELVPEIDPIELKAVLRTVNQGDLLDIAKLVFLWSPDAPSHPSEVAGVPHEEPVMTEEMRLPSGLCAVISQDCDIRQLPDIEPYILVCPLSEVEDKTYKEAAEGMSVRYFAYPAVEDHEHMQLAADGRMIQSIEKTALLSPHVKKVECPLGLAGASGAMPSPTRSCGRWLIRSNRPSNVLARRTWRTSSLASSGQDCAGRPANLTAHSYC